jgi:hypothetical protein
MFAESSSAHIGSGAMTLRSSLMNRTAVPPTGEVQLDAMRRAAWHRQGVVMLRPDEIEALHPWLAQAARSWAIQQFGSRKVEK